MRPDVAAAFDRMAAAASADGIALLINDGFRSDAEQAVLWAQNPDPRWVAPPGTSLHRCATELDLGPRVCLRLAGRERRPLRLPAALLVGGLALRVHGRARRRARPRAMRSPLPRRSRPTADSAQVSLPSFVPARFRDPIAAAARRWNVSAALLAAQLMAESNFNPFAVSPAGAAGIAQFMPGTAAMYGLGDPFDAEAAIDAQAHLMSDLLEQFGDTVARPRRLQRRPGAVAAVHLRARLSRDAGLRRPHPRADGRRRRDPRRYGRRRSRCGWWTELSYALAMPPLTISGIDELRELIGKPIGPSDWVEVTQEDIDKFAEVSRDDQWIHVDVERAERESPFGTTVAHGNLTLSLIDGFRAAS